MLRGDFNEYVHESFSNRIDVADAASALLDVFPYVPESMAKALFATRPFNDGTISFDDWWGDIEKFFAIAKHITHGTRPESEVYLCQIATYKTCYIMSKNNLLLDRLTPKTLFFESDYWS